MISKRRMALFALIPLLFAVLWMAFFPHACMDEPCGELLFDLGAPIFCAIAAFLLWRGAHEAYVILPAPRRAVVVACVAAFAVALCNLPWHALFVGTARLTAPVPAFFLFVLLCFSVASLEELVFRGLLLPALLCRFRHARGGRLSAVLLSSAVFGLSHLANLFFGADPVATLLQVSYSFLVGCVAAVIYLLSARMLLPILFHALYNFGGLLVFRLGEGKILDAPTVILTVVVGASAAVLLAFSFFCGEKQQEKSPKLSKK